jgi:para-aminobenzoate synthetase / 4-amino-4-deoxychorismate lyase
VSFRAVRIPLECGLTPEEVVLHLRGDERPFALVGEWAGLRAVLGSFPARVLAPGADPFAALADLPAVEGEAVRIGGGWFGLLGYGLGALVERLPAPPPAPVAMPAHRLAFHDHVVVFDGERWWFEALREDHPRLEVWRRRLACAPSPAPFSAGPFTPVAPGGAGHRLAVEDCVRRIGQGELFQANLTLRLEAGFAGDPLDAFARALPVARPRFGACLEGIVSLSPERFLRRVGRHVESDPIKGTAGSPEALAASEKDAAEHVMIVDLMRNDLGRVCRYGSICAGQPRLEAHANVWHLVSTVAGELLPEATDADLLRATFPPGSVTGAPKVQAMKVIAALEATRREAYTGAIGYASPLAGLELSVAIRTFETAGDRIWIGAGGGIVADSDPEAELAEALTKAAGPIAAISSELGPEYPSVRRVRRPTAGAGRVPRALELGPRPDPARGLLETILVLDGVAQSLEAHLDRLAASAREVYGVEPPADLGARIAAAAAGEGRIRATLTPQGRASVEQLPPTGDPVLRALTPHLLPGGLGRHKWADRRLADALGPAAILLDADGAVLEATWANVFVVEGDRTVTPPADGRLLPGIRRATTEAREEPLTWERLLKADAVLLTSALRRLRYSPSSRLYSRA